MATTSKQMFNGAASLTNTTLYTVPSATTSVVTEIIASNTSSSAASFTINLNNNAVASSVTVPGNSMSIIDMKQVLTTTQTIKGSASATTINFFISGIEIA